MDRDPHNPMRLVRGNHARYREQQSEAQKTSVVGERGKEIFDMEGPGGAEHGEFGTLKPSDADKPTPKSTV